MLGPTGLKMKKRKRDGSNLGTVLLTCVYTTVVCNKWGGLLGIEL